MATRCLFSSTSTHQGRDSAFQWAASRASELPHSVTYVCPPDVDRETLTESWTEHGSKLVLNLTTFDGKSQLFASIHCTRKTNSTGGAGRVPRGLTPRVKAVSSAKRVPFARCTVQSYRSKHHPPSPRSTILPRTHHPTGILVTGVRAVATSLVL